MLLVFLPHYITSDILSLYSCHFSLLFFRLRLPSIKFTTVLLFIFIDRENRLVFISTLVLLLFCYSFLLISLLGYLLFQIFLNILSYAYNWLLLHLLWLNFLFHILTSLVFARIVFRLFSKIEWREWLTTLNFWRFITLSVIVLLLIWPIAVKVIPVRLLVLGIEPGLSHRIVSGLTFFNIV